MPLKSEVMRLVAAYAVSAAGSSLYRLAVPLAIYDVSKSSVLMSITYAASILPIILLSLHGGVIADRYNRWFVLVSGDALSVLVCAVLALAFILNAHTAVLIALVFLLAAINAIYEPSFYSSIPLVAEKTAIPTVNSAMRVVDGVLQALGPLIGGLVVILSSASVLFAINGLSFAVSAVLMWTILSGPLRTSPTALPQRPTMQEDILAGIRIIMRTPFLRYGLRLFIFTNLSFHMFFGSLIFYLSDTLKFTSSSVGFVLSIGGIGSAISSLYAPRFLRSASAGTVICISTVFAGTVMLLFPLPSSPMVVGILLAMIFSSGAVNTVLFMSKTQQIVDSSYLGRVGATNRLAGMLLVPIAALAGGIATSMFGFVPVTIVCGLMRLVVGTLSLFANPFRSTAGEVLQG